MSSHKYVDTKYINKMYPDVFLSTEISNLQHPVHFTQKFFITLKTKLQSLTSNPNQSAFVA